MKIHQITEAHVKEYDHHYGTLQVEFYIKDLRRSFRANFRVENREWNCFYIQPLAIAGEPMINSYGDPSGVIEYINKIRARISKQLLDQYVEIREDLDFYK
ncbi:hypothetical protein [Ammoniphilus sp. CFH 90114]|uniref:hypothetical protein n=1 Tax=Ammoniphilus sp. CFH 90114 TaxID=2493665 RepID=UPI00100FC098|nr:hypothetical protein [Ammoniphilus sp. CFH 90114]RXT14862.1 hypothetical protein EIZ39_01225 [Ammoniphilus sp. CFH 90114]